MCIMLGSSWGSREVFFGQCLLAHRISSPGDWDGQSASSHDLLPAHMVQDSPSLPPQLPEWIVFTLETATLGRPIRLHSQ